MNDETFHLVKTLTTWCTFKLFFSIMFVLLSFMSVNIDVRALLFFGILITYSRHATVIMNVGICGYRSGGRLFHLCTRQCLFLVLYPTDIGGVLFRHSIVTITNGVLRVRHHISLCHTICLVLLNTVHGVQRTNSGVYCSRRWIWEMFPLLSVTEGRFYRSERIKVTFQITRSIVDLPWPLTWIHFCHVCNISKFCSEGINNDGRFITTLTVSLIAACYWSAKAGDSEYICIAVHTHWDWAFCKCRHDFRGQAPVISTFELTKCKECFHIHDWCTWQTSQGTREKKRGCAQR